MPVYQKTWTVGGVKPNEGDTSTGNNGIKLVYHNGRFVVDTQGSQGTVSTQNGVTEVYTADRGFQPADQVAAGTSGAIQGNDGKWYAPVYAPQGEGKQGEQKV